MGKCSPTWEAAEGRKNGQVLPNWGRPCNGRRWGRRFSGRRTRQVLLNRGGIWGRSNEGARGLSSKFIEQAQSWGAHAPHVNRKFREHASPTFLRVRAGRMRAHVNAAHAPAIVRHSPARGAVESCSRLRPDPLQLQSGIPWSAHRIVRHSRSDNQCFERGPAFVPPHPGHRGCGVAGGGGHPRDRGEAWDPTPHPSSQRLVSFTCVNSIIN